MYLYLDIFGFYFCHNMVISWVSTDQEKRRISIERGMPSCSLHITVVEHWKQKVVNLTTLSLLAPVMDVNIFESVISVFKRS